MNDAYTYFGGAVAAIAKLRKMSAEAPHKAHAAAFAQFTTL